MGDEYENNWCHVHVFTLRSNAWIPMEKTPYNVPSLEVRDMWRLPVNGALHWISSRRAGKGITSQVILSFNLENEEFKEMQFPEGRREYKTNLCILEGSLCLFGHIYGVQVDLWELKNFGMENSWTKLFNIDIKQFGYIGYLISLWRFENGEILLGFDRDGGFHTGLYSSEHQTYEALKVYGDMTSYSPSTSIYVESLHSLRRGTYLMTAGAEAEEEKYDHKRLGKCRDFFATTASAGLSLMPRCSSVCPPGKALVLGKVFQVFCKRNIGE
ncbi:F-box/kelch-repeat protein At3g06240-like [Papaver somniferum]|uniref:F-box/kelch-repeat protein At3g06240-like n=1 Tax=Papaver somniferum TaxID=3469 RepID=UPI000E705A4E|nr:F-box/kelch-repeat protein At3g06240-like [Papaver somniferum]